MQNGFQDNYHGSLKINKCVLKILLEKEFVDRQERQRKEHFGSVPSMVPIIETLKIYSSNITSCSGNIGFYEWNFNPRFSEEKVNYTYF